jgi:hypothetical protein
MNYKKQLLAPIAIAVTLSACSTHSIGTQSKDCAQIGCADGLQFYPHEEYSAVYQHRRFYGVDGVLPEDLPLGSPERAALRRQQIIKLRSIGLDANGRPLNQ